MTAIGIEGNEWYSFLKFFETWSIIGRSFVSVLSGKLNVVCFVVYFVHIWKTVGKKICNELNFFCLSSNICQTENEKKPYMFLNLMILFENLSSLSLSLFYFPSHVSYNPLFPDAAHRVRRRRQVASSAGSSGELGAPANSDVYGGIPDGTGYGVPANSDAYVGIPDGTGYGQKTTDLW